MDNTGKDKDYKIKISAQSGTKTTSEEIDIQIVTAMYKPELKVNKPIKMSSGSLVYLDDVAEINGPVLDVRVEGVGSEKVEVTKRSNANKGFSTGELLPPDKTSVEKDFVAVLYTGKILKIYGDPTIATEGATEPVLVDTIVGSIRDFSMETYGIGERVALVYKEFYNNQYDYTLMLLTKSKQPGQKPVYSREVYSRIYTTKEDFDDVKLVSVDGGDIVIAMPSKKVFITNYLKLVTFRRETGRYVKSAEADLLSRLDKLVNSYSLVHIGKGRVAIVACSYGELGLQTAIWDTSTRSISLVESSKEVKISDTESRKVFAVYLRCFEKEEFKVECMVDAEGINDYLVDITFNPAYEESGEQILSIVKIADFEMPPYFDINRAIRGKEIVVFHLKKNQASHSFRARLLQNNTKIDKFSDCENIIVAYKPQKSKYIYTGISCSAWGNSKQLSVSAEDIGGRDFIFYTKGAKAGTRILQGVESNERIGSVYVSGVVLNIKDQNFKPESLTLKLVGLNGEAATDNTAVSFSSLTKPPVIVETPSSMGFWSWFFIILGIIIVIVILVFVVLVLKNKQSSSSSAYYKPAPNKPLETTIDQGDDATL